MTSLTNSTSSTNPKGSPPIKIQLLTDNATLPKYAKPGDAAMDLYASESTFVPKRSPNMNPYGTEVEYVFSNGTNTSTLNRALVPTGVAMAIPEGYYGRVAPRSGLSVKGFDVGAGVIDSGYRGEIKILLINNSDDDKTVERGERVAQLIITRIMDNPVLEVVDSLDETERGSGGFGSTGSV